MPRGPGPPTMPGAPCRRVGEQRVRLGVLEALAHSSHRKYLPVTQLGIPKAPPLMPFL